jgi:8-oxo-dGTP diphosphatase
MTDLAGYPRPSVAVDVAVLSVVPSPTPPTTPGRLAVLVHERDAEPAGHVLPGRFLRENETIAECVRAALRDKAGLEVGPAGPRLLRVFDTPGRDPRGWTLSLAHALALPPGRLVGATGTLVPIGPDGRVPRGRRLLFDHGEIVREAAADMRGRYELSPDPDGIIDGPFTLTDLKTVHEAVLGERLARDTFRRRMAPQLLPHLDGGTQGTRSDGGRPARLWTGPPSDERPEEVRRRLALPRA